jgi:hypothetical protein
VVPALYIGIMALVVVNTFVSQRTEAVVGVGFIAAGAVVYYLMFTRCRDEKDGKALLVTDTARGGISPWRSSSPPG